MTKKWLWLTIGVVVAFIAGQASAQEFSYDGMEELQDVCILVEPVDSEDTARTGLTSERLSTMLMAAVRRSRTVEVTGEGLFEFLNRPFEPTLYLQVTILPLTEADTTVYSALLSLKQLVVTTGQETGAMRLASGTTWKECYTGIAPDSEVRTEVRDVIRDMVDKFTVAWHEANPQGED